jgi:hypothetical protein
LSPFAALRGSLAFAALALVLTAGCQAVVDVDSLGNGKCAEGTKPCPGLGQCVPLDNPETGCADTSCAPCALPHAVATCTGGACAIDSCIGDYKDCDPNSPGCETDLAHDPGNCGECLHTCQVDNGFPGCSGKLCTVGGCDPGYTDCNGTVNACVTTCP